MYYNCMFCGRRFLGRKKLEEHYLEAHKRSDYSKALKKTLDASSFLAL